MATLQQIEQNLLNYSAAGNFPAVISTINSITPSQLPLLNPFILGTSLNNLAIRTRDDFRANNDINVANVVRDYASKLINFTDAQAISSSLLILAQDSNFDAIDGITDSINITTKERLNPFVLGQTLQEISAHTIDDFRVNNNINVANAARDYASKLINFTDAQATSSSLQILAQDGNFRAEAAITDYANSATVSSANLAQATGHSFLSSTNNNYTGTTGRDVVFSREGNDTLNGAAGQ
jgi:hypothetical protein